MLRLGPNDPAHVMFVGGPRCGKSWGAREYAKRGYPVYCGDPLSKVKDPEPGTIYLPEGIPFSGDDGASQWVLDNWLTIQGPWVLEGHVMARVLRRWFCLHGDSYTRKVPCDRIIVCLEPKTAQTPGQAAMTKAVATVWNQISHHFAHITEYR